MRMLAVVLVSLFALAANADSRPQPQAQTRASVAAKQPGVMHYRTLEKMLRRFSSIAGEARTRG